MQEHTLACQQIEIDKNYQPNITSKGLLSLVMDEKGGSKHFPSRSAVAIQESTIKPLAENGELLGKLYHVKIADKSSTKYSGEYRVWNVDAPVVILVDFSGKCSIHSSKNARIGNFNAPLMHLTIGYYLNKRSLSFVATQNQMREIKKNSEVLHQAYETRTSFFTKLSPELLTLIASLTNSDIEIIPQKEAYKIACDNFKRPISS